MLHAVPNFQSYIWLNFPIRKMAFVMCLVVSILTIIEPIDDLVLLDYYLTKMYFWAYTHRKAYFLELSDTLESNLTSSHHLNSKS